MYTQSKSEDVWTSLMLHERGWKSIFIPKTLAVGDAPETIEAYTKQQQRWATGGFEILFTHNPFNPKRKLTLDQRFMYFVTATFYLTGIARHSAVRAGPGGLLRPAPGEPAGGRVHLVPVLRRLLRAADPARGLTLGTFRWEVLLLAANSFRSTCAPSRTRSSGSTPSGTSPAPPRSRPPSTSSFRRCSIRVPARRLDPLDLA